MVSESDLVDRFRASGDGRWFDQLYRLARRRVFAVCRNILREDGLAEDACHDAFVTAWEKFPSLRGQAFTAWVCRIAANRCLDLVRRRCREEDPEDHDEPAVEAAELRRAVGRQELATAHEIVRSLAPHQRVVFLLFHLDGASYAEIAARTGYTGREVRSYLQNARRNLHLALERERKAGRRSPARAGSPAGPLVTEQPS